MGMPSETIGDQMAILELIAIRSVASVVVGLVINRTNTASRLPQTCTTATLKFIVNVETAHGDSNRS